MISKIKEMKKNTESEAATAARRAMRVEALKSAWAILRPMPGKMAMLRAVCVELGWPMWTPVFLEEIGRRERPMFPGYLFVQPPLGHRRAIAELPFCAGPMEIVIFDSLRAQIDQEEVERREEMRGMLKRSRVRREPVVCKGFDQLKDVLEARANANVVDIDQKVANVIRLRERDSALMAGILSDYQRTDDDADAASASAEAMFKRRLYFQ